MWEHWEFVPIPSFRKSFVFFSSASSERASFRFRASVFSESTSLRIISKQIARGRQASSMAQSVQCTQTRNHKISVLICWKQIDCEWPTKGWLAVAAIAAGADDDVVVVAVAGKENYRLFVITIKLKFHIRIFHIVADIQFISLLTILRYRQFIFVSLSLGLPSLYGLLLEFLYDAMTAGRHNFFVVVLFVRLPLTKKALSQMPSTMRVCFESIENRNVLRRYGLVRAFVVSERDNSLRHAHKWENGSILMFNWSTTIGMQTEETSDENDILCSICIMCRKKTFECVIDRRRILVACRNSMRKRAQQKNCCDSIPQTYVLRTTLYRISPIECDTYCTQSVAQTHSIDIASSCS